MDRQIAGFKDHYKLRLPVTYYMSVRRGLSILRRVTIAVFHYPRYPWEQKWSHGRYIAMILLRVHPFRAKCCAQCFTMPMLAKELEYREDCIVFFLGGADPSSPFPQGGRLISSEHPERGIHEIKT